MLERRFQVLGGSFHVVASIGNEDRRGCSGNEGECLLQVVGQRDGLDLTLHELDLRRWAGFIGQTHLDDTVVDPDLLDAWLADEGFQASQREALIREFDSGRRLLNAYDDERRE